MIPCCLPAHLCFCRGHSSKLDTPSTLMSTPYNNVLFGDERHNPEKAIISTTLSFLRLPSSAFGHSLGSDSCSVNSLLVTYNLPQFIPPGGGQRRSTSADLEQSFGNGQSSECQHPYHSQSSNCLPPFNPYGRQL